jgi:hypothetical protein
MAEAPLSGCYHAAREDVEMLGRPVGVILLAAALLAASGAGIAGFSVALVSWLTTSGTSPLALIFALAWSCTFTIAASSRGGAPAAHLSPFLPQRDLY